MPACQRNAKAGRAISQLFRCLGVGRHVKEGAAGSRALGPPRPFGAGFATHGALGVSGKVGVFYRYQERVWFRSDIFLGSQMGEKLLDFIYLMPIEI